MTSKEFELNPDLEKTRKTKKFPWYWSPVYCSIWFVLFYVAVIPSFYSYPETLSMRNEHKHPDEFIGERAQKQLLGLSSIGVKLTGTVENEVLAVAYLLKEIDKIKATARLDLYDIDVDVQHASGQFMLWDMATSYHNVSNVIVRLSPKNSQSQSYLLLNSHFDSEIGSPAAADAGIMIVIMLETLRVISHSAKPLRNPIVFLLNGAEEANLLAAHGFITQHPWAEHCKALINLDSAGAGGRELLFQSGPDHPWLMKYYKQSAVHPYATTIAEEFFQNDFIPSDTDFRIFRDYRGVPGLDMAHNLNGYIYHTKYDNFQNVERGTYQSTGENVLALTWAIANAPELQNTTAYAEGHTVFYDYLGWFLIFYTASTGIAINVVTSVCALLAIGIAVFLMARANKIDSAKSVYLRFLLIVVVQLLTVFAAAGLNVLIAVIMDALGLSLSWYSEQWLTFGLYFCPIFFVLGLFQAIFIDWTKGKTNMALNDTIACFMHAHCIILVLICLLLTGLGVRSAFFTMIAIFFYTISMLLNLMNTLWFKRDYFLALHLVCQVLPFWFYTYLSYTFLTVFIPMQGRDGPTSKPELIVGGLIFIMTIHFAGFILPILHKFRKSKILFLACGVLTIVFVIIAATPAGFPFKKNVAPQRYYILHTNRVIHDEFGVVKKNESGFYVQPVDPQLETLQESVFQNALPQTWTDENCATEVFCGLPLYNTRWMKWKNSAKWIPAGTPNLLIPTELILTSRDIKSLQNVRYNFILKSTDRIVMYIEPNEGRKITDWSFDRTLIEQNSFPPYFIYHVASFPNETSLVFHIDVARDLESSSEQFDFRIGVGAHYMHHISSYTQEYREFLNTFPDWSYTTDWFAAFESWIF